MRLPSHLLAKLTLAGLAVGCEPAHESTCERAPIVAEEGPPPAHLDDVVRMTNERMVRPAVAPRFVQPQPQPQQVQPQPTRPTPQPVIKKKPPRKILVSICGHAPQLLDESAALVRCGKG